MTKQRIFRVNFFSIFEKMESITKSGVSEVTNKMASHIEATPENYIKLRLVSDLAGALAKTIDENSTGTWKGVEVNTFIRKSTSFDDAELAELEAEAKELAAKIKARKTYLKEVGEEIVTGAKTVVTMKVPK